MRMSGSGVENVFLRLRWPETDGRPVCPDCGCSICYACRRPEGQLRWRCKACRGDFSITSGTLFAWHKLPLRTYLLAVAGFCNEVKGKSMLAFSRELDVQYKTAFVLAHKLREAMASGIKGLQTGGEGAHRANRRRDWSEPAAAACQDWANTKATHRFFSNDRMGEKPCCGAEEPERRESE